MMNCSSCGGCGEAPREEGAVSSFSFVFRLMPYYFTLDAVGWIN